jgi:hypothetical protein
MMKKLLFLIILISNLTFPSRVLAQNAGFSIKPENPTISYFTFTINPGESVEDALIVSNNTKQTVDIIVKAVDGQSGLRGGISFDFEHSGKYSQWVTLEMETVPMKSGRIKRVGFTITVPPGTPPGEYLIGFLAVIDKTKQTAETPLPNSFNIENVTQIGISAVINVPGQTKCKMEITGINEKIEAGRWQLDAVIQNQSTEPITATGKFILVNKNDNSIVISKELNLGYTATGSEVHYPLELLLPPEGVYIANVSLISKADPACLGNISKDFTIGIKQVATFENQATRMAFAQEVTLVPPDEQNPSKTSEQEVTKQNKSANNFIWLIIISAVLFLASIFFFAYSQISLRKRKNTINK